MTRVKAILFDMGNVLVDYTPARYAERFADDSAQARALLAELFHGPEWLRLDRGDMTIDEALLSLKRRLPATLFARAEQALLHWYEYIAPRESMDGLVALLKRQGFKIYVLSNASVQFDQYKDNLPVMARMDGLVISAFERVAKPDPAIYRLFKTRYGLAMEDCLFIDDIAENAEAARAAGMHAYCYADQDEKKLVAALRAHGAEFACNIGRDTV